MTALRGGMDLADVQQLVGHTSAKTTERYAGVAPDKLMNAAALLQNAMNKARLNVRKGQAAALGVVDENKSA